MKMHYLPQAVLEKIKLQPKWTDRKSIANFSSDQTGVKLKYVHTDIFLISKYYSTEAQLFLANYKIHNRIVYLHIYFVSLIYILR